MMSAGTTTTTTTTTTAPWKKKNAACLPMYKQSFSTNLNEKYHDGKHITQEQVQSAMQYTRCVKKTWITPSWYWVAPSLPFCPQFVRTLKGVESIPWGCFPQLCQVGWMSFGWWTILNTHRELLSTRKTQQRCSSW
jgi:hypothetical protein